MSPYMSVISQFRKAPQLARIATQTICWLLPSSYAQIPAQEISSFTTFSLCRIYRPPFTIISSPPPSLYCSLYSTMTSICFPPFSVRSTSTVSYAAARCAFSFSPHTRSTLILGHRPFGDLAVLSSSVSNPTSEWNPPLRAPVMGDFAIQERDSGNHWVVLTETTGYEFETEQALFNFYIRTLASVVGSDEEAKRRIYFVSTKDLFGFGAEIDEETGNELEEFSGVTVLQDGYYFTRKAYSKGAQFIPTNWNHRLDDILSYHHLSERNPKWNYDHWLVHIKQPDGEFILRQKTVNLCLRLLAHAVGSEEDAKKKLYVVWCKAPFGFGAEIDEQTVNKLKALPDVQLVVPDYAFDVGEKQDNYIFALVVSPLLRSKSDLTYCYYQPSQVHSKNLKQSLEESLIESVTVPEHFIRMNLNLCVGNIFSYHHMSEWNPLWNFDHWLIVIKIPEGGFAQEGQILDLGVKILAKVVGSERDARERIYTIWCKYPCGFGVEIDGDTLTKLQGCPQVLKVLPDYGFNLKDKAYRALFITSHGEKLRYHYYNVRNFSKMMNDDRSLDPNEDYYSHQGVKAVIE